MNLKISKYYDQKQAQDYEARRNNPTWHAERDVFNEIKKRIATKYNNSMIKSSVEQLPQNVNGKFNLIIMTRFLSHFSISEIRNIMNIVRNYSIGELVVSFRIADEKSAIFSEIFDLLFKSPIGAIKRYRKSGRLSYTRLETDYLNVIKETGFHVNRKNLVVKDKYNRYEYWELSSD